MDKSAAPIGGANELTIPRSHRLVRRLTWLFGTMALTQLLLLTILWVPARVLPELHALASEIIVGGGGGLVLATLLLVVAALLATLMLTAARHRHGVAAESSGRTPRNAAERYVAWLRPEPGGAARQLQALILPLGAILAWTASSAMLAQPAVAGNSTAANIAGAFIFAFAFVSLVAERVMNAFPEPQLPEAPALRRLLLLATVLLAAAGCIELGRGAALTWIRWPTLILEWVPVLVAVELACRALARMFLPPPPAATATAVSDSILVGLLTGGPRAPGTLLRTHLGLDFARSWALSFLSAALLPAVFATGLLCWALSGLKLIDLGQRGIYERFGAPVEVVGPGLHLLLPWPLGRLRPVEFGTIHSVAIGVDQGASETEPRVDAEATPPAALNRLWETNHPGQADYVVPSTGTGPQGFQSVSTEISVLYRVGLSNDDALQFVYAVADPEALIREAGSRLVLRYFNSRTLDAVLGARRDNVAGMLRDELAQDVDAHKAGVEIVAVLIQEVHPPAGAATAYHAVQAAQINATASISDEIGRARRTAGVAQQEAHQLLTAATAAGAETLHAANADSIRFSADRRAHEEAGEAFLLERSYNNLKAAVSQTALTVVDHRLKGDQVPIIDQRAQMVGGTVGGTGSVPATAAPAARAPAPAAAAAPAAPFPPLPAVPAAPSPSEEPETDSLTPGVETAP
jgi:regulator of protease activity HflC (stomatin/prohibitin superfamily)